LAQLIIQLTKSKSGIDFKPLPADDPAQRKPDITLAKEKLGWNPETGLKEGLLSTIKYFRDVLEAS